jgi:voltage-gated potassium channel
MELRNRRPIWKLSLLALVLIIASTLSLHKTAHLSYPEALYSTIIILLTHYDHNGLDDPGSRGIILVLIVSSLGFIAYLLTWFAEYMIGLSSNVRKQRVKAKTDRLKNHYIVCGLGRVGSQVAKEMHNEGVDFIALDKEQANVDAALAAGYLAMCLDSTDESALYAAGIERAAGLVASLGEDSLNLFVTLAARSIHPDIYIVARGITWLPWR